MIDYLSRCSFPQVIVKLSFGRRKDPVLAILRRALREAR
jgi:hypothetical protein